jgi:DNA-binding response OmpR family regulator
VSRARDVGERTGRFVDGSAHAAYTSDAHATAATPAQRDTPPLAQPVGMARMTRVLVVEADPAMLRSLVDNFRFEDFDVLSATDGEAGDRLLRGDSPDVAVVDATLPGLSGEDLCRRARADGFRTPIIMLAERGAETERLIAAQPGADDYVSKPFSVRELVARVRALLRRVDRVATLDELRFDDVVVDFKRGTATIGAAAVEMTHKEFAILQALAARSGDVVPRDALVREVWGHGVAPNARAVDTDVATLRAKLEKKNAPPRHLLTVPGVGYRWVP